jgi:hypothetical protein
MLAAYPVLILNLDINKLNNNWYFLAVCLAAASCVDPLLSLIFSPHKISADRKKFYVFKIIINLFIVILSLILPMQATKNDLSLEQSNDLMFIVFSMICFGKFSTVVDEVLLKNRIIAKVSILSRQLWPFLVRTFALYFLAALFYFLVGQILFGGKISSQSVIDYKKHTNHQIRDKYQYFTFNDTPSSALTLLALLLQNNWLLVSEQLFFVHDSQALAKSLNPAHVAVSSPNDFLSTSLFLISYNFFVVFILTALVLGISSKLIITYFEDDFQLSQNKKNKQTKQSVVNGSRASSESEFLSNAQ